MTDIVITLGATAENDAEPDLKSHLDQVLGL